MTGKPNQTLQNQNWILTKKAQLGVDEKNKKRNHSIEHRTHANRRLKPHSQTSPSGGMREYNRSLQSKKSSVLRLIKRK
jgi:hypothetical protein